MNKYDKIVKNRSNKDILEVSKDTTGNYVKGFVSASEKEVKRRKASGEMRSDAGERRKKGNNDVFGLPTSFKW